MKSKTTKLLGLLLACFSLQLSSQDFDVYISDAGNFNNPPWQVLKADMNGENLEKVTSDHLGWPQDIVFLENENAMLVTNLNDGTISKFNADTGAFMEEFATGIGGPTRMEIGPDSLLYVLQWQGNGLVKRYQLDGTYVDDFTQTGVGNSIGIAWDADDNLYVSSYNGNYVKKFGLNGEDLGNFISSNLSGPTNIWFNAAGEFFVANWNGGTVGRFDSGGNFQGVFISGVPEVEGVDFFPNGDIALGVGGQAVVRIYDSNGNFIKDLFPAGSLGLIRPNAVVFRFKASTPSHEAFQETTFVTPTIGTHFQISNSDALQPAQQFEVYDSSGALAAKINFNKGLWDASNLTNGIYYLTAKMKDGKMGRQKVVVQH